MRLQLPEVDMDQYSARLQISANDYAVKKATEYIETQKKAVMQVNNQGTTSSSDN